MASLGLCRGCSLHCSGDARCGAPAAYGEGHDQGTVLLSDEKPPSTAVHEPTDAPPADDAFAAHEFGSGLASNNKNPRHFLSDDTDARRGKFRSDPPRPAKYTSGSAEDSAMAKKFGQRARTSLFSAESHLSQHGRHVRRLRSRGYLTQGDLEVSEGLRQILGLPKELSEVQVAVDDEEEEDEGIIINTLSYVKSSEGSGSDPEDVDSAHQRLASKESKGSGSATRSLNLLGLMPKIKNRFLQFRNAMKPLYMSEDVVEARQLKLEQVYDFFSFEGQRTEAKRMDKSVFHHRVRRATGRRRSTAGSASSDDAPDDSLEEAEMSKQTSHESSQSDLTSPSSSSSLLPERERLSLADPTSTPPLSPTAGGKPASPTAGDKPARKSRRPDGAASAQSSSASGNSDAESASSASSPSSSSRAPGKKATRKLQPGKLGPSKLQPGKPHNPAMFASTGNKNTEAVAHWGVMAGKLMHSHVVDFGKLARRKLEMKRVAETKGMNMMFTASRERAKTVAKQAREVAKKVCREPQDTFDSSWGEGGFLVELFGQEYVDTLAMLARSAHKICAAQPPLVEATAPCRIFGDIHGQFRDMLLLFRAFGGPDEHNAPMFVFNGDFVDRGEHQLEVVGLLLAFKVLLPEKVWLVRGNHEFRFMNERYGFLDECKERLGSFGPKLFELFHRVFDVLPVACLISKRVLCIHGGVGEGKWNLDDVRGLKRPFNDDTADPSLDWVHNLLWSDPIEDDDEGAQEIFGVHESPRGGYSSIFGWNVTKTFCARNGLSLIIRSHQSKQGSLGFDIMHENLLMRVFSARDYEGHGNDGAVLFVRPADERDPSGLLLVRPQVLQSTAKSRRERAEMKRAREQQEQEDRRREEAERQAKEAPDAKSGSSSDSDPERLTPEQEKLDLELAMNRRRSVRPNHRRKTKE